MHAERTPSGIIKYEFEFHRPVGVIRDELLHLVLESFEYTEIILVAIYVLAELYMFYSILVLYFKEKKLKVEIASQIKAAQDLIDEKPDGKKKK